MDRRCPRESWRVREMENVRLSRVLCAAVGDALRGSHATLEALFLSAGAPGEPPGGSHAYKWKEWLFRAGQDPNVDSLEVLGNVLEEFMDLPPDDPDAHEGWQQDRERIEELLEQQGLRYFRFGRVLPQGEVRSSVGVSSSPERPTAATIAKTKPTDIEDLVRVLVSGLPRAMHPLTHRRKNSQPLSFSNEYDVQDLLHALLRPWVADIRPEEFTPSYAGSSTRMDFLLPAHDLVIELKFVRDRTHAKRIGDELTMDIAHYGKHPKCHALWCVVYDPKHYITNAQGLCSDLSGKRSSPDGETVTTVLVL